MTAPRDDRVSEAHRSLDRMERALLDLGAVLDDLRAALPPKEAEDDGRADAR
jgi:hypothetical protein